MNWVLTNRISVPFLQEYLSQGAGFEIANEYNTDNPQGTRKWIRRLMAMALVPPLRARNVIIAVIAEAPVLQQVADMNTYFCNTYVNPNALFQSAVWNVFDAESRTMNVCEGFHSSMNRSVGQHHPDILKVIEFYQRHEEYNERIIAQLNMGAPPTRRRQKYELADATLQHLKNQYVGQGALIPVHQILTYLDAVSHQLWDERH